MTENLGTHMYDAKYESKDESSPRSIIVSFIDNYLAPGQHCLDLGCGAGRHSKYLVEKNIVVSAVDISEVGVHKTKEILSGHSGSEAIVADIHNLPFDVDSFDSIISNRVLDYNDSAGLEIAFVEVERVLKTGGLFLLIVRSISQLPKTNEKLTEENMEGGKTYQVQDGQEQNAFQHYFTEVEINNLAKKHNLSIEQIREQTKRNSENEVKSEWQVVMKKL